MAVIDVHAHIYPEKIAERAVGDLLGIDMGVHVDGGHGWAPCSLG